jgi:hypothetical protein
VDNQAISSPHYLTVVQRIERWDGMLTASDLAPLLAFCTKTVYPKVASGEGVMPSEASPFGISETSTTDLVKWLLRREVDGHYLCFAVRESSHNA